MQFTDAAQAQLNHFNSGISINFYAETIDTSTTMTIAIAGLVIAIVGIIVIYIFIQSQFSNNN
ncbi:MAG: hypothetical protein GDA43_22915 [Hormoscilla sp. SP5CHS1]|nr:hypothetical protein [Hormoscilla sp. SP5CHS1]